MAQIIVNSIELKRFARLLVEIAEEIRRKKMLTTQRLDDLKKTLRGDKMREFETVYANATQEFDRFIKASLAYARYLEDKAVRVERYLSR